MNFLYFIAGFLDTISKGFKYGGIFVLPIILVLIILIIKRKKNKKYTLSIALLSFVLLMILLTSRSWGPVFYKNIIKTSIDNKQDLIEEKLEKKYNKNFTFVSKGNVEYRDNYLGSNVLGGDIDNDYVVKYKFKDDDGVIAIVKYQKNYASDFYESKRSRYELEKSVYEYAKKIGLKNDFYVFVESPSELINNSELDKSPRKYFIFEKRDHSRIKLYSTKKIENCDEFMYNALKEYKIEKYSTVSEYVVTEEEYKKIVDYYESETVKSGIEGKDYEPRKDLDKIETDNFRFFRLREAVNEQQKGNNKNN